mmetsp:Transcript_101395/g.302388  ORF Transcript_101395/g.302388 Transcript_101395/m.302388 type:complete len:221 (+) Transcript_101395:38-700(+)
MIGTVRCVVFDLDDTLWNTVETLDAAHKAMRTALAERCPELDSKASEQAQFREEMRRTMEENPERKHDFTFVRHETLKRVTGSEEAAAAVFEAWFQKRNSPALFPGAREALLSLRDAGLKIGTLTDGNANPLEMEALRDVVHFHVSAAEGVLAVRAQSRLRRARAGDGRGQRREGRPGCPGCWLAGDMGAAPRERVCPGRATRPHVLPAHQRRGEGRRYG